MEKPEPPDDDEMREGIRDAESAEGERIRNKRPRPDNDDEEYASRRSRRSDRGDSTVPCPKCGSRWLRSGPWPWYLGTIGAIMCTVVTCRDCGHEFDKRKPQADWGTRKIRLALILNGIGLLGIIAVCGGLAALILSMGK